MTLEEFEMLTEEQKRQALAYKETYDEYKELEAQSVICKCKPTYNFQSIEFEWHLTRENYSDMYQLYCDLLQFMIENAPEQMVKNGKPEPKEPEEPATEKQIALLNKLGVKIPKNLSLKQARILIKENL